MKANPNADSTAFSIATPASSAGRSSAQSLMIAGGMLLGTVGIFVEEANQHPLVTVLFRCAFGVLALLAWGWASGRTDELKVSRKSGWIVAATGCLMILNWGLFFAAIQRTSIAVATIVFHIQPVWIIIFGAVVLREPTPARHWAATLLALCGLVLATGIPRDMASPGSADSNFLVGLLMCLGGSLSYAAVTILARQAEGVSPFALATWQCVIGAVVLAWVPFAVGLPDQASTWAWLAGLGIVPTGLAYAILFAGMARLTLGRIAVLQFVYPLTAVVLDWCVYGRALDTVQLGGIALMGLALWAIRKPV